VRAKLGPSLASISPIILTSLILKILGLPRSYAVNVTRFIRIDNNFVSLLKPEEKDTTSLPRDKLLDRLLESSTSYYAMTTDSETVTRCR
jgi:hypothetical protein